MSIQQNKFKEIADAIRAKTGETGLIKPSEFAGKVEDVYDAGKQSEYDYFWDTFQENGKRTNYAAAFGGWNSKNNFKPKYPIKPVSAYYMFYNNTGSGIKILDFVQFCEENNVVLDYSECTNAYYGIAALQSAHFGTLDFSKCTVLNSLFYSHSFCDANYSVKTIDAFISSETTAYHSSTFQYATNLTNLNMVGVIAKNNFNVSYCPKLTHDSLMTIINCLKDYSDYTGTTSWVCTLGTTNLAKLTDEEKAIATEKGWTLA